jgi:hypothetical protein
MADVVHVKAPDLELAATTVAQHIETAATPPSTAAPLQTAVASPVDGAASGAAGAIRAKMAALSAEMAPKGSADGAAAAEKALKDYEAKNNTKVIRQQIKVAIIDPKTGQPMLDPLTKKPLSRFYDGLDPIPGQPGKYIGIEVKSGTADLTRTQSIFDTAVSPQTPATGSLNGEPVEVVGADKLDAPQFIPEPPAAAESPPPEIAARAPVEAPPPLEGGLGAGPSEPVGPRLISPGHHPHHIVGDWDPDPEEVP